jgi:hypothetical protein
LHKKAADEMANSQAIGLGDFINVIGCDEAPSAGHILHNNGRITRDVLSHMPRNGPGVGIKTTSGRKADNYAECLALIKIVRSGMGNTYSQGESHQYG